MSSYYEVLLCENCVGALAKLPSIYHIEAAASERNPSAVLNSSIRRSEDALLSNFKDGLLKIDKIAYIKKSCGH